MKVLVIDNYDSFTFNLVQILRQIGGLHLDVIRNDKSTVEDISHYDKYVISPGPGVPSEAPLLRTVIEQLGTTKSILGICLGHQAIGETFGGKLVNLDEVYHGVATDIQLTQPDYLFNDIPARFKAGRYHSWAVAEKGFPDDLDIIATDNAGAIMAIRHQTRDIRGVQFHPESILTEHGVQLLRNFIHHQPNEFTLSATAKKRTK